MAAPLLTQQVVDTETPAERSQSRLVARMTNPQRPSDGPPPNSQREINRLSWAWLDALGRSLGCAVLLVDPNATPGPLVGAMPVVNEVRSLLNTVDSPLLPSIVKALRSGETHLASVGSLVVMSRQLRVQGVVVGSIAIAKPTLSTGRAPESLTFDINTIESWLTPAVEAQLGQPLPEKDDEEAFDKLASLHRLLHDVVDSGSQRDVVTAFAEALFAWDGIEVTGYVIDVQGQWMRGMSPPGTQRPALPAVELGDLIRRPMPIRLASGDLVRLGFSPE